MVDDRVEGHVFALKVSLSRLHVVVAMVALNEALKLTIHNGAMSQGPFLTWISNLERYICQRIHTRSGIHISKNKIINKMPRAALWFSLLRNTLTKWI